jgi:trimeric autotransporter adhesin
MRARRIVGFGALVGALAMVAGAGGTTTPLPGGTSLDVTITSPSDGATLPQAPVTVTGTAAVGEGARVASTTLIYVVDVSGSTQSATGVPGKCPRQNVYDATQDTTLDCELLAIRDLNTAAIATGTVSQIGMIGFAGTNTDSFPTHITSAAVLDLDPSGAVANLVAPDANTFTPTPGMATNFTPHTNLDWVVQSAYLASDIIPTPPGWPARGSTDGFTLFGAHDVGSSTNYTAALDELNVLRGLVPAGQNVVVAFLSDGIRTRRSPGRCSRTSSTLCRPRV